MNQTTEQHKKLEWLKCRQSATYFVNTYVQLYDASRRRTVRFELWGPQYGALLEMTTATRLVILKARQLGLSWLCLAYALWLLVFHAPATILLFSLREAEAKDLLHRLRFMYGHLPRWMQARELAQDAAVTLTLSTGSRALAFSTRSGRGYTGSLAVVDEADYIPDLGHFLNAVKPTIDGGGQLFLVSTSDKTRPVSAFKNLFRAATRHTGDYRALFLPWHARPDRDRAWYVRTRAEMFAQRGTDDDFLAEYPASIEEALAPEQLNRRLPLAWVSQCTVECRSSGHVPGQDVPGLDLSGLDLPGLTIYQTPRPGRRYVVGADPAEGNPHSDESAATVVDGETWAQVAVLAGRVEPGIFAGYLAQLAAYYNDAGILVERNNHGHSVLLALAADEQGALLHGYDGKPGWLNNVKGKPLLYAWLADALRSGACEIRDGTTANQLASIQASDLAAPSGLADDRAMSFALAIAGAREESTARISTPVAAVDPLENNGW